MRLHERPALQLAPDHDVAADRHALPRNDRFDRVQLFAKAQVPDPGGLRQVGIDRAGGGPPAAPARGFRIRFQPLEVDHRILQQIGNTSDGSAFRSTTPGCTPERKMSRNSSCATNSVGMLRA